MDLFDIAVGGKLCGGGGGDTPTLIDKTISANGTYNASDDEADGYKKVVANVPNTYASGDEGKVVSNGALVAQSSTTKTANGTYDTTLNNSVTVNVPSPTGTISITQNGTGIDVAQYAFADVNVSGGGGGIATLLTTKDMGVISYNSTTAGDTGKTVEVQNVNGYDALILEFVAGDDYKGLYSSSSLTILVGTADGKKTRCQIVSTTALVVHETSTTECKSSSYGLYPQNANVSADGTVNMHVYARYSSSTTGSIDTTYTANVYGLKFH